MKTAKRTVAAAAMTFFMLMLSTWPAQAASQNVKVLTLRVGNSYKLTVKKKGKKKVKWKSSKKSVASVSKKGVVKAKKAGNAKITAKVGKKKYVCKVVVLPKVTVKKASKVVGNVKKTTKSKKTKASGFSSSGLAGDELTAWKTILAFQEDYPEGTEFTNDDYYQWNGGIYRGGYGCAAFCFMLSDACFGANTTDFITPVTDFDLEELRPGDIIRVDYNTHSVTVVNHTKDGVIIAEANYNKSVHWGRKLTYKEINKTGSNIMSRYSDTQYTKAALMRMHKRLPVLRDPKD